MSYIRSTSNPENLYVWGDGKVTFFSSRKHGPTPVYHMPTNIFHGLIRKWHRRYQEATWYKGAEIKEVWVYGDGQCNELRIQLSYDAWNIKMWCVTWDHIAFTNLHNINRGIKNKNKITIQ